MLSVAHLLPTLLPPALLPLPYPCSPLAQRVLSVAPVPAHDGSGGSAVAAAGGAEQQQAAAPPPPVQQQQFGAPSFAVSALQPPAPAQQQQLVQRPRSQQQQADGEAPHPATMPVSAVAAGWAPDRAGQTPTGSGAALGWRAGGRGAGCAWLPPTALPLLLPLPTPLPPFCCLLPAPLQRSAWMR